MLSSARQTALLLLVPRFLFLFLFSFLYFCYSFGLFSPLLGCFWKHGFSPFSASPYYETSVEVSRKLRRYSFEQRTQRTCAIILSESNHSRVFQCNARAWRRVFAIVIEMQTVKRWQISPLRPPLACKKAKGEKAYNWWLVWLYNEIKNYLVSQICIYIVTDRGNARG